MLVNQLGHTCQFHKSKFFTSFSFFAATPKSDDETRKSPTTFQCQNYRIPIKFQCDGLEHCVPDGTDEIDCQGIDFLVWLTFPLLFLLKEL